MWRYNMGFFAEEVVALLDHLDVDQAVVGGTSLGANVTLEVAALAPARLRGMVVEMPVLDNALLGCALAFTPLLVALTFGEPLMQSVRAVTRRVPRLPWQLDIVLDTIRQDPKPSAAVLQGLFFGRTAPPREIRGGLEHRTLVIGHYRDPIHPFSDSDMLVREMPNARLVEASSILELRLTPERLTNEIVVFVEECFAPPVRRVRGGRKRASA
jgi:pimeloyl-ACP methyl ester carboxylesterase